jgi:hypothetical protein
MLIYLAVAIDKNTAKPLPVGKLIIDRSIQIGGKIMIYLPAQAFSISKTDDSEKKLISINKYALSSADAVVVSYSPGVESWGLPMEMLYAKEHNIPIYLVSDQSIEEARYDNFPIYLRDLLSAEWCFDISRVNDLVDMLVADYVTRKGNNEKTVMEKDS